MKNVAIRLYHLLAPICDPIYAMQGILGLPSYVRDWRLYSHLPDAEKLSIADAYPQLHDRSKITGIDTHYFYTNGWATRRIITQQPAKHVDVGSSTMFVNLLSAVLPVIFVDYRPLNVDMTGLKNCSGDILNLPFDDGAIASLSCLHVSEHIGLGRYGDPLYPQGTHQACMELQRVLAPGGNLYFVVPVGRPRVCFNAHRIHAPETIVEYFAGLKLKEFSGVHDGGRFVERVTLGEFAHSHYACGMFWFQKAAKDS